MTNDLDYKDIKFAVSKRDYEKIEHKHNIKILSLSCSFVETKILTDLCSIRQNVKIKNYFVKKMKRYI